MTQQKIDTLILGGGLAGLSACYHGNGIVFEKAPRAIVDL